MTFWDFADKHAPETFLFGLAVLVFTTITIAACAEQLWKNRDRK